MTEELKNKKTSTVNKAKTLKKKDKAKQKFFNDYLEVITFFVFILILLVIYIPSIIWEEEDMYK